MSRGSSGYLSNADKQMIVRRQGGVCAGFPPNQCPTNKRIRSTADCEFDHIRAYRMGQYTDPSNIQALCHNCHVNKTRYQKGGDGLNPMKW